MSIPLTLAQKLKEHGFPQLQDKGGKGTQHVGFEENDGPEYDAYNPTLEELIENIRDFHAIVFAEGRFVAWTEGNAKAYGNTISEALARLYIEINKKA